MRRIACLLLTCAFLASPQPASKHRVLFNRFRVPEVALFVADADGKNEFALPHGESEYSPSLTSDGKWIVFTSEHAGQSDLYRIHPDGTGLDQLTDDPAFDDQGSLSPDGKSSGLRLHTGRRLRKSLAARSRQPQIPKPHTGPLGKFPAELVTGQSLDRLQLRSRCQSRKVPRAMGAHAVYRDLFDSPGRYRLAASDQDRRICRQPVVVLRREERALLRDR